MPHSRNGSSRFGRAWRRATRMMCLAVLLTSLIGCAAAKPQVVYLREGQKATRLRAGEAAPHDGWLLTDGYLAELYDLLERKAAAQDAAKSE